MASRKTVRGYRSPNDDEKEPQAPSPVAAAERTAVSTAPTIPRTEGATPPPAVTETLELEHVHESGTPQLLTGPWRAVEIWTRNRIYGINGSFVCTSVTNRSTGAPIEDHVTLGARLLGGQRRAPDGRITQVAHPVPERGMAAVFADGIGKRLRVSETSQVTRVVLRQRVVDVGQGEPPSWDDITGPGAPRRR